MFTTCARFLALRSKPRRRPSLRISLFLTALLIMIGLLVFSRSNRLALHAVAQVTSPANDTCSGAIPLTLNIPLTGSTVGALNDYQLSGTGTCFTGVGANQAIGQISSAAAGRDVVYSFTAPTTGGFSVRVTDYTAADLVLYTATSCPTGGPPAMVTTCQQAANRTLNRAEEVFNLSLTAGQQILIFVDEHAISASGDSSFAIEVNRFEDEFEGKDEISGNNVMPGALCFCPTTGVISPGGDRDFYRAGGGSSDRVFALADGIAANDDDFFMQVTTTSFGGPAALEYDDSDDDSRFGSNSPNIAGRSLSDDSNKILGLGDDSVVMNHRANSGPYRLYSVVQADSDRVPEREPNNSLAQANSAISNYYYSYLSAPGPSTDVDFYAFTAKAGDLIFLSLDSDPLRNLTPINARLQLLDASGSSLVLVDDNNASSFNLPLLPQSSPAEGLVFRARTTGIYFAKVSLSPTVTDQATGQGDYILSITKNCGTGGGGLPGQLQFSASNYSVNEIGGTATITVSRINGSDGEARVNYATRDDTAIAGQDYKETLGTLIFANGVTSRTFTVPINNDALDEVTSERITLTLSNPSGGAGIGATLGTPQTAVLTIIDDDPPPTISIQNKSVVEGNPGDNPTARFTIRLSTASGQNVGVVANTANDTASSTPATAGIDYIASTSSVGIPAGSTTGFFDVPLIGDRIGEPNETFLVNLFGAVHATIGTGQAVGTIQNDDFIDTIGVFRPSSGQFLLRNTNTAGPADTVVPFGGPGTKPVAGDWDGDGIDDVGFFNPATGQFSLREPISVFVGIINGVPTFTITITVITVNFGQAGDLPVVGDWNGDGIDTPGVFRPGSAGTFFLTNSNTGTPPSDIVFNFGTTGDLPVAGDWNGDGIDTIGVFRPGSAGTFFLANSFANIADVSFNFGTTGDLPFAGDWIGEGIDKVGVFRPSADTFFLANKFPDIVFLFGQAGDLPVAGNWSRKAGDNNPPNSGVNDPDNGSSSVGQTQVFTTTCSDPDGWHDIATIDFKVAKSDGQGNGVPIALWVQFNENGNLIRFYDPDTQTWSESVPGSSSVLSSRFAELHLINTSKQGSGPIGPSVQVRWEVIFKDAAVGNNYKQYLQITDDAGLSTGFDRVGSWSIRR